MGGGDAGGGEGCASKPRLLDEEEDPPSRKLGLERREHLREEGLAVWAERGPAKPPCSSSMD